MTGHILVRPRGSTHQSLVGNRCKPVGPRRGGGALSRHRRRARGGALPPPHHCPNEPSELHPTRLGAVCQASLKLRRRPANATGCARVGSIPACVGENTTLIRIVNSRATKALAQRWAIVKERVIKHVGSARTSRVGLAGVCVCVCVCVCAVSYTHLTLPTNREV